MISLLVKIVVYPLPLTIASILLESVAISFWLVAILTVTLALVETALDYLTLSKETLWPQLFLHFITSLLILFFAANLLGGFMSLPASVGLAFIISIIEFGWDRVLIKGNENIPTEQRGIK